MAGRGNLILKRREREVVVITTGDGDRIEVQVMDIRAHCCRLAFRAPDHVEINRLEVQEAIDAGAPKEEVWRL